MEHYVIDNSKERQFRQFFQSGGEMDGHIYSQEGEGIGSFFGNLFKKVLPFATKAIKGATGIAKPHIKQAVSEITEGASKEIIKSLGPRKQHKRRTYKSYSNLAKRRRVE